ncbi:MAG: WxL domain-containing protein [Enterococcaceae bacterium]|nr:WxL domain-containing protein [Enterococcaceae bacterium]
MKKISIICLLFFTSVLSCETAAAAESEGTVDFAPASGIVEPVHPYHPEEKIVLVDAVSEESPASGQEGPLSIDFASSFDFGANKISAQDQVYFAEAQTQKDVQDTTAPFVQVSDHRGTATGWILTLKQNGQLRTSAKTKPQELSGAQIVLKNARVNSIVTDIDEPEARQELQMDPAGTETVVLSAEEGAGTGTWTVYWGALKKIAKENPAGQKEVRQVADGVVLKVPGSILKAPATYHTELIWNLKDIPKN